MNFRKPKTTSNGSQASKTGVSRYPFMKAIPLLTLAATLFTSAACTTMNSGLNGGMTAHEARNAAINFTPGEQTLIGLGITDGLGTGRATCAGKTVYLIPHTRLSQEQITTQFGHTSGGIATSAIKLSQAMLNDKKNNRKTTCNANGKFVFKHIKGGVYYLITKLSGINRQLPGGTLVASLIRVNFRPGKRQAILLPRDAHIAKYLQRSSAKQKALGNASPVLKVQQALAGFGLDAGIPDGILHARTRKAIKQFQKVEGLYQTGAIDNLLLDRIKQAKERRTKWTSQTESKVWTLVATDRRNPHGVAAGRDRLEAFAKAVNTCEKQRDGDPGTYIKAPCVEIYHGNIDKDACVSFIVQYASWMKGFGISKDYPVSDQALRKDSVDRAFRACGSHKSFCKKNNLIGPKNYYTYCASDFRNKSATTISRGYTPAETPSHKIRQSKRTELPAQPTLQSDGRLKGSWKGSVVCSAGKYGRVGEHDVTLDLDHQGLEKYSGTLRIHRISANGGVFRQLERIPVEINAVDGEYRIKTRIFMPFMKSKVRTETDANGRVSVINLTTIQRCRNIIVRRN